MKKTTVFLLVALMCFAFCSCRRELSNKADTSLEEGEIMLTGYVAEAYDSMILLQQDKEYQWNCHGGDRVFVALHENISFVEDGWYITDISADSLKGKHISVICSEFMLETYPAQLINERMVIILD